MVFVGRKDELQLLQELAGEARAGRAGAVWVAGDPGIGKSALIAAGPRGVAAAQQGLPAAQQGLPAAPLAADGRRPARPLAAVGGGAARSAGRRRPASAIEFGPVGHIEAAKMVRQSIGVPPGPALAGQPAAAGKGRRQRTYWALFMSPEDGEQK